MPEIKCAYDETVEVGKLVPNPRNPNKHPKKQIEMLAGIIEAQGWRAPITVSNRSGFIVRGHCRLEAALLKGWPDAPVDRQEYASEAEEWADMIADNKIAELAETDEDMLLEVLKELDPASLQLCGIEDVERMVRGEPDEAPEPQIDRADELREKWQTERGQVWEIGKHRLMCGDSTKDEDVGRLMCNYKADLTFTDPPYGVGYDGGAKRRDKLDGDQIGTSIYMDALPNLLKHAADHAALYLWYADAHAAAAAAAAAGYEITAQIIWVKNHAQFVTSAHYKGKHEPCFYGHRRGKIARWSGPNNEVTVWECNRSPRNDHHPTQKPVDLAARAIRNSSNDGDIVLDLFLGGGSTMVAAEQLGRICYGMEIEPKYVAVVLERMSDMGLEPKLVKRNG